MKIVLADISGPMVEAWKEAFSDVETSIYDGTKVEFIFHKGSIFDIPCDAIVSPANSFGFMNGGIDLYLSQELGWHVMQRVQQKIVDEFDGELLVGQSLTVPTDHKDFPYLISAPTMRVSMGLATATRMSANVYLAARAVFLAVRKNESINSVVMSGLGTGVGNVSPIECARKMRMAFDDFYAGKYKFPRTLSEASDRHDDQTNVQQLNGEETL